MLTDVCCCSHTKASHVRFGRHTPCIMGTCPCEDFDFGGGPTRTVTPHVDTSQADTWPKLPTVEPAAVCLDCKGKGVRDRNKFRVDFDADGPWIETCPCQFAKTPNCGECVYPTCSNNSACPNKGKTP